MSETNILDANMFMSHCRSRPTKSPNERVRDALTNEFPVSLLDCSESLRPIGDHSPYGWLTESRALHVPPAARRSTTLTRLSLRPGRPRTVARVRVVFGGQYVGIREVAEQIRLVSSMKYDLGFFDQDEDRVETSAPQPVHSGQSVNDVSGIRCKRCAWNAPLILWCR